MIDPLHTREITSPADERIIDRLNEVIEAMNTLQRTLTQEPALTRDYTARQAQEGD